MNKHEKKKPETPNKKNNIDISDDKNKISLRKKTQ